MEFKEKLISSHLAFEEDLDLTDSVHDTRAQALKIFEEKGFPSKKDELWKYTSLDALIHKDYSLFPKSEASIELKDIKKYFLYDSLQLFFLIILGTSIEFLILPTRFLGKCVALLVQRLDAYLVCDRGLI